MRPARLGACVIATTVILATVTAVAHQGATGIVKERMETMSAIARELKTLAAMVKSNEVDGTAAKEIGARVAEDARRVPDQFPEGSLSDVSEARDTIWTDFADFEDKSADLATAAAALAERDAASLDRTALAQALKRMGRTCKSCHESYRLKKN